MSDQTPNPQQDQGTSSSRQPSADYMPSQAYILAVRAHAVYEKTIAAYKKLGDVEIDGGLGGIRDCYEAAKIAMGHGDVKAASELFSKVIDYPSQRVLQTTAKALQVFERDDYETAFRLSNDADLKNAGIRFLRGYCRFEGVGTGKDLVNAKKDYLVAAQKGHSAAQINLARMFLNGDGGTVDVQEALRWYKTAAEHGVIEALVALAIIYEEGTCVTQNPALAFSYYLKAYRLGDTSLAAILGKYCGAGHGSDLPAAERLTLLRAAEATGDPGAVATLFAEQKKVQAYKGENDEKEDKEEKERLAERAKILSKISERQAAVRTLEQEAAKVRVDTQTKFKWCLRLVAGTFAVLVVFVILAMLGVYRTRCQREQSATPAPDLPEDQVPVESLEELPPPPDEPKSEFELDVDAILLDSSGVPSPNTVIATASEPTFNQPPSVFAVVTNQGVKIRGVFSANRNSGKADMSQREKTVMKALRWLKKCQNHDGSWPTRMSTELAVLTFLTHGETPNSSEFGETVRKALDYLLLTYFYKDADGAPHVIRSTDNEGFCIATYAFSIAYGITQNPNIGEAARMCLTHIIENQSSWGGWNRMMDPTSSRVDLSFTCWILQALNAGRTSGLDVHGMDQCRQKVIDYLRTSNPRKGNSNLVMRCLCLQLLNQYAMPGVQQSLDTMQPWEPTLRGDANNWDDQNFRKGVPQDYCYFVTLCKYLARDANKGENAKTWVDWSKKMLDLYPRQLIPERYANGQDYLVQDSNGRRWPIGYWKSSDQPNETMYACTCRVALQLMVDHLPMTNPKKSRNQPDVGEQLKEEEGTEIEVDIDL